MNTKTLEEKKEQYIYDDRHEQMIMERYANMQKLQTAIELGNTEAALALTAQELNNIYLVNQLYTSTKDTARVLHNRLASFNTMCIMCAYRSNPNPLYLHAITRHYDTMIEKATTTEQCAELMRDMILDYCNFSNYSEHRKYSDTVQQAIWLITADPARKLDLNNLARTLGMSPAAFSRKFHQETGSTLSQYHTAFRVRSAQHYLQEGHLSITQVAHHVGFSDASYFSKVFMKYAGVSPTQYIANYRKSLIQPESE